MATTTAPEASLSVDEARSDLEAARRRVAEADARYRSAHVDLAELDAVTDPRVRATPAWFLGHDRARSEAVDAAEDLAEAREQFQSAERAVNAALASQYTSGLPEWRSTKHTLALEADQLLTTLDDVLSRLRQVHLVEVSHKAAAGVSGPDVLRHDRLVASGIYRALIRSVPAMEFAFNVYRVGPLAGVFAEYVPPETEQ